MKFKILIYLVVVLSLFFSVSNLSLAEETPDFNAAYTPAGNIIPNCAINSPFSKECLNVSVFAAMAINVGRYLFTIVGALALLAFTYGGFTMLISGGNEEKTKQGFEAITASAIGLAIAFGGYVIVIFLSKAMGVGTKFLGI